MGRMIESFWVLVNEISPGQMIYVAKITAGRIWGTLKLDKARRFKSKEKAEKHVSKATLAHSHYFHAKEVVCLPEE
jgi:hypothetical protein